MKKKSGFALFTGIDKYSLALFRIALGVALFLDILFYKLPYLSAFYTNEGILSTEALSLITQTYKCSLLYYINSLPGVILFFIITLILCILYIIGYKVKPVSLILYVFLFSIHERNAPFLSGSDAIFRVMLFWSLFLPVNSALSLFPSKEKDGGATVNNLPAFAILLQIALIYFFNAWNKSGETWKEGSAIAYALMIPFHKGVFAEGILNTPLLYKTLTYFTLLLEYAIAFLIFSPFYNNRARTIAASLVLIFHWGLLLFLNVGDFYLTALPVACLLMPATAWKNILPAKYLNPAGIKKSIKEDSRLGERNFKPVRDIFIFLLLLIVIGINIRSYNKLTDRSKKAIAKTCNCIGLSQKWSMFGPDPTTKENGYIVLIGQTPDNRFINLTTGEEFIQSILNKDVLYYHSLPYAYVYVDHFLPQFLHHPELGKVIGESWGERTVLQWNREHPDDRVSVLYIARIYLNSEAPGKYSSPQLIKLYEYRPRNKTD